ncbi:MAG TPA: DNA translocase FtsK, partial [Candidatus Absconditabacterales bacterium]|nr:DNA translocase FtsK [Candidatus Absconditabacterales bacterium]
KNILARRKYKRRKKTVILSKYKLGAGMIILGGLYFFSLYLAEGSPIFELLTNYASVAFGEIGLNVFFGLCILVGILILYKGYLMNLLIKQFLIMMMLVSGVLNFPIIDGEISKYQSFGGYLSWPLIELLNLMFGSQATAVKSFIVVLLIATLVWILYTFNFSLPKINFKLEKYAKPKAAGATRELKIERQTTDDIAKKINETRSGINRPISDSFIKTIIKQKVEEKIEEKRPRPVINFSGDKPTFNTSILKSNTGEVTTIDEKFLMEKAKSLQDKLMEFNVAVSIEGFDIGPTIVQIRIKPEAGIAISKIESLVNDIKLSLKSKSLRIIAPIPGTDSVGIQIPNQKPTIVRVGDMLSSKEFQSQMAKSNTNLTLGRQIDGSIITKTLEDMPHLLIAGATGSGKSVGVNDFIISLMYQNSPSELKFLMVDPKQVELELYSGLPYMLAPIVSEPEQALKLLKRAVDEMEKRYGMLKDRRVKNIGEYNQKVMGDKMYRIVFVIDELADMMMHKNKKEVETYITRIAQKARAIGIHLILATQRPSVNVITGLIKANMPTRIAFGVVSEIDSRTILGRKGAEDLVGRGDMLYMDPSTKRPIRIQAPFVETSEIELVVNTLKDKYMRGLSEDDVYNPDIIKALESKLETAGGSFSGGVGGSDEELVEQAIQVILETRKASATLLQRKLNIGFARAARIMDELEERGVIGPQEGAKARDIFI